MKQFTVLLTLLIALSPILALAGTSNAPVDIGSTGSVTVTGSLPAGTAVIGKTSIDQTTPGTTNGVQVNAALPAGANVVGKMGIDQTTPGTTNGVQVNAALPAGTNILGKMSIDQTTPGTTNAHSLSYIQSTAVASGNGVAGAGVQRVVIASDQTPFSVTSAAQFSTRSDTYTATANGTTVNVSTAPLKSFSLAVKATGAVTSWTVVLECSLDNVNFTTVLTHSNTSPGDGLIMAAGTNLFPCMYFRTRASAITLGAGTNVVATILGM